MPIHNIVAPVKNTTLNNSENATSCSSDNQHSSDDVCYICIFIPLFVKT